MSNQPLDPIIHYAFKCPHCGQKRNIIKGVSETEMICGTCSAHLRKGNIRDTRDMKPKHFFHSLVGR